MQIPFYPPQQQFEEFTEEVVLFLASCHSYYSASSNLFQCPLRLCLGLGFNMVFFLHVTVICQVLNLTWIFAIQVCKGIIYDAAGTRDIEIEVKTIKKWSMHAQVAASYFDKYGRIILVGDAAHRFPPAGGFGDYFISISLFGALLLFSGKVFGFGWVDSKLKQLVNLNIKAVLAFLQHQFICFCLLLVFFIGVWYGYWQD